MYLSSIKLDGISSIRFLGGAIVLTLFKDDIYIMHSLLSLKIASSVVSFFLFYWLGKDKQREPLRSYRVRNYAVIPPS